MRANALALLGLFCSAMAGSSVSAEYGPPERVADLRMEQPDLPEGFVLYGEEISRPGPTLGDRTYQWWARRDGEQELKLVEETTDSPPLPVGGYVHQTWYRGEIRGESDRIETEVVIYATQEKMAAAIRLYTDRGYIATVIRLTASPVAGDRSWLPITDYDFVMFARDNVLVRLYISLHNASEDETLHVINELATRIDNRILLWAAVGYENIWGYDFESGDYELVPADPNVPLVETIDRAEMVGAHLDGFELFRRSEYPLGTRLYFRRGGLRIDVTVGIRPSVREVEDLVLGYLSGVSAVLYHRPVGEDEALGDNCWGLIRFGHLQHVVFTRKNVAISVARVGPVDVVGQVDLAELAKALDQDLLEWSPHVHLATPSAVNTTTWGHFKARVP